MDHTQLRSNCPINFSLEVFGDAWSLLILRDIIYFGKKSFNEFLVSDEKIARNILASRLIQLQRKGLLVKKSHPKDGRKEVYMLTKDGLDLIPILLEMAQWGSERILTADMPQEWLQAVHTHRETLIPLIRKTVEDGGSIFVGPESVAELVMRGTYS